MIMLDKIEFSEPLIFVAIEPITQTDHEKMAVSLSKLVTEEASFQVHTDEESGQTIISSTSELHLDILVERLRREFQIDANVSAPQVLYRETIRKTVEIEGKFKRQSSCPSLYGHVWLMLEPKEPGFGFQFFNQIMGDVIPKMYIPAVNQGVIEAMQKGVLAGYPVVDVCVTLFDGSFHEVDSNERAYKIAGYLAFKAGAKKASPVLLEPIMAVEIVTPEDYMGNVIGDLNRRRAFFLGMDELPTSKVIQANVPLGEMFGYTTDLQSLTQGGASYTMQLAKYAEVPNSIANTIIKKNW